MLNLKYLRNRVKSIKSTQKITKAMQMVSASKLRKVREQIANSALYIEILDNLALDLLSSSAGEELSRNQQIFFNNAELKTHLLVLMSSNKGLCGSFNSTLVKKMCEDIADFERRGKNIKIIVIGRKGYAALSKKYSGHILSSIDEEKMSTENLSLLVRELITDKLLSKEVDACHFYYGKFKNALTQVPSSKQIIPLDASMSTSRDISGTEGTVGSNKLMDKTSLASAVEHEGANLFTDMIDMYVAGYTYYCLLQSKASEEGSRMTAMDNATKNANDLIGELTLKLNRTRQASITKELTEIISGAESI